MDYGKLSYLRFVIPFIAGILVAVFLPFPVVFTIAGLSVSGIVIMLLNRLKWYYQHPTRWWLFGAVLYAMLFFTGTALIFIQDDSKDSNHFSQFNGDTFLVRITEDPVEGEKSFKLKAKVIAAIIGDSTIACKGKVNLYLQKSAVASQITYGDVLILPSSPKLLEEPKNPSEFNFKRYMEFHSIYHQVYLDSTKILQIPNVNLGNSLFTGSYHLKHALLHVFDTYGMDEKVKSVTSALMIGSKELLDDETIKAYSSAGATHVLAVSGLHVGVIFLIVNWLLRFLDYKRQLKYVKLGAMLLLLWGYALLTGLSPSVIRAATMLSFVAVGGAFGKRSFIFNTVSVSAFFLLLFNPYLIMEVGFQLSYMAVLGIIALQPGISKLLSFESNFMTQVWAIISVSIAAQIGTAPLGLLYFHQFPVYFLFSNLVVIPAASIVIYTGLVFLFFHAITAATSILLLKGLSLMFFALLNSSVALLNSFVVLVEQSPNALIEGITISVFETYWIYAIFILFYLFFSTVEWRYFYTALVTFSLLVLYDIGLNYYSKSTNYILFYSIKNTTAIELKRGGEAILVADSALLQNEDKMLFHIKHNWWEERITECKNEPIENSVFKNEFAAISSGKIWFNRIKMKSIYHPNDILCDTVRTDILLIEEWNLTKREAESLDTLALKNNFRQSTIVLGNKIKYKNRQYCKRFFDSIGLKYNDLAEGSYRFTI